MNFKTCFRYQVTVGAVILLSFIVVGCGTIMHGSTQGIGFTSSPSGASVTVDNHDYGITPTVVTLGRKNTHIVKIDLPTYKPFEVTITRSVSGWAWGNIVLAGTGLVIDAISGGLYKLSPEQVHAAFSKEGASLLYCLLYTSPSPRD